MYYHSGFRVDWGVMVMKGYSIFPKAPEQEPYYQMFYYYIQDTYHWRCLAPNATSILYSPS